jgi:ornithine cyclodeaminase
MRVLVLSQQDVYDTLGPAECERAMAEVLVARARGEAYEPLRSIMAAPEAPGFMGLMPAHRPGDPGSFSLKAICVIPANPQQGLDAHQGTVTLFDGAIGVPTAILNASAVTEIRTAAVSAVATRSLARADSRVLAILGAGVQGRAHLRAFEELRTWQEIRIYSPTTEHAQAVAADHPLAAVAASAREAVEGADVVVAATNSGQPVLERDWLADGAHLNAVGASGPTSRELDVATVAASALFCDSRESLRNEAAEYRLAVQEGAITGEDHVRAELGEVLAGLRPGRRDASELTLFRSLGIAVEDLAAASLVVANARRSGIGVEVEL